jgi:outer membrane protein TolC
MNKRMHADRNSRKKLYACLMILAAGMAGAVPSAAQESPGGEVIPLRRAVALAVQNSREVALVRLRHNVSEKSAGLLRSSFRPNLYTGTGAAWTEGFPQTPGGPPTVFNLSYTQTVFNLPLTGQVREAQEMAKAGRVEIENVENAVRVETAAAYLELAKVRHGLRLLRTEQASAQKIVEVTSARVGEGLELPIEITRAKLTAARIEQRIVQHEGREEYLTGRLRQLMGLPAGQGFEVSDEQVMLAASEPVDDLVSMALVNSTEIKQAEHQRLAREHRLRGEKGGYLPTMDLVSYFGVYSKANDFDRFYNSFERTSISLGVRVRVPIFSSTTSSAVALARSELSAAEQELRNKREALELNVRQQSRQTREMDAGREVARLEMELAQENVRVLQAQFQEGRLGLRDLEKARLEEHEKWLAFLDAEFQQQRAHLELLRTTGRIAQVLQ